MQVKIISNKELTYSIVKKLLRTEAGTQYILGSLSNSVYIKDDTPDDFNTTSLYSKCMGWLDQNCNGFYWWEQNRLYFFDPADMLKFKLAMDGAEIDT